jgi:predicted extracellular nuclease
MLPHSFTPDLDSLVLENIMKRPRFGLLLVFALLATALPITAIAPAIAASSVIINEMDADQSGTDAAEFVELYDGGAGSTDLSGLSMVLYNGSDDASYLAFDLDGLSTDANGYFVLCGNTSNVANCDLDVSPNTNLIQNGADAVALIEGDAVDYPNDTPVSTTGLIDAIVYDTSDGDDAGLLVLLNAGQPQVNERGGGDGTAHSNQRCQNGEGGARNTANYIQDTPTPGETNNCPEPPIDFGSCFNGQATLISTIQGSGSSSPEVGNQAVIEGVVVGDFQDFGQLGGFFVQEEDFDTDNDKNTSEGIFVFDFSDAVDMGDVVRVRGTVDEFFGQTQITSVTGAEVCASGSTAASASQQTLPMPPGTDYESIEGMSVFYPQTLVASDNFTWGRFGEVGLSVNKALENPTNVVRPGNPANNKNELNDRSRILLDDGSTWQNPEPPAYLGEGGTLRVGDTLDSLTGVMGYGFDRYRIQPTEEILFTRVNDRPVVVPDVGGSVKVAAFNVLNYFTTIDAFPNRGTCGPNGDQGCRGADSAFEFGRQKAKLVTAITTMDADVIGIMEVENSPNNTPINDLVDGLNAAVGAGTYAALQTGAVGDDAIRVGFIYKPGSVTPSGDYAVLDESVDPRFNDDKNRPAIAQTFAANSEKFTVAVNHLKSKGSPCDDISDSNTGDQQGNCNGTRTAAAEALADWMATDPTGSGDADFLIIGDLNSYANEDPISALTDAGYTDLIRQFNGPKEYSFVFFGEAGYLDHGLANKPMKKQVTGAAFWHINADEPSALDYNSFNQDSLYTTGPWRSSDHDPVIIGLNLGAKG